MTRELYETINIDARLAMFKASMYLPLMLSLSSVWLFFVPIYYWGGTCMGMV